MELAEFLGHLHGVRQHGSWWEARCPAHEDRKASLSVSAGDQVAIVVHCHAGCEPGEVLAALNLSMGDLYERRNGSGPAGYVIDRYVYTDERSEPIFAVERLSPKGFRQARWTPTGWEYGVKGCRKPLYRLPSVLEAVGQRWVVLVEGEKDAECARRLGFVGTTWAGGVNSWNAGLCTPLHGADVVVIPDDDPSGHELLPQQVRDLKDAGAKVRVVHLGGPKDLTDWEVAGGTAEQFRELVRAAVPKLRGTTGATLETMTIVERDYVVPGILPVGLGQLLGLPKAGKSIISTNLVCAVLTGSTFLGIPARRGDVIWLALEDTLERIRGRVHKMLRGPVPENVRIISALDEMPRLDQGGLEELEDMIRSTAQPALVLVDTFGLVKSSARAGESVYDAEYRGWRVLKLLADRTGVCCVGIHHDNKSENPNQILRASGTNAVPGAADVILSFQRTRGTKDRGALSVTGRDVEDQEYVLAFDKERLTWRNLGEAEQYQHVTLAHRIAEVMGDHEWSAQEVADELGEKVEMVRPEMARLVRGYRLERTGRGRYRIPS